MKDKRLPILLKHNFGNLALTFSELHIFEIIHKPSQSTCCDIDDILAADQT